MSKHGLIEAKTYNNNMATRVYLDGFEVTKLCTAANDIEGWVDILKSDDGKYALSLEPDRKHGNVLIVIDEQQDI